MQIKHSLVGAALVATASVAQAASVSFVEYGLDGGVRQPQYQYVENPTGWVHAQGGTSFGQPDYSSPLRPRPWIQSGSGAASIEGWSAVGTAKIGAAAEGTGYSTFAWSGWTDRIAFSGGPVGQQGVVSFNLAFDWQLSLGPTQSTAGGSWGEAFAFVDINLMPVQPATGEAYQYAMLGERLTLDCFSINGCTQTPGPSDPVTFETFYQGVGGGTPTAAGQIATMSFGVIYGEEYDLTVGINAAVTGQGTRASVNATHSLVWEGISSMTDQGGAPLAYTVSAESGADYSSRLLVGAPARVPEPAPLLCIGLGGVLALIMRRRLSGAIGAV